jgi:hypothetical protein
MTPAKFQRKLRKIPTSVYVKEDLSRYRSIKHGETSPHAVSDHISTGPYDKKCKYPLQWVFNDASAERKLFTINIMSPQQSS